MMPTERDLGWNLPQMIIVVRPGMGAALQRLVIEGCRVVEYDGERVPVCIWPAVYWPEETDPGPLDA